MLVESTQTLIFVWVSASIGHSMSSAEPHLRVDAQLIANDARFTHALEIGPVPSEDQETAVWPLPHAFARKSALSALFTQAETLGLAASATWRPTTTTDVKVASRDTNKRKVLV